MSENGRQPDWIKSIHLKYFTAFEDISIDFSPGINFIIGENGTGKTHLLKVMYAVCRNLAKSSNDEKSTLHQTLDEYFQNHRRGSWNLVNYIAPSVSVKSDDDEYLLDTRRAFIEVDSFGHGDVHSELIEYSSLSKDTGSSITYPATSGWGGNLSWNPNATFIPAKEMLSHNKGLVATMDERHMPFERQYRDILSKAAVNPLRDGNHKSWQRELMDRIAKTIGGPVVEENEVYYVKTDHGPLEFTLVAEGHRKLALYWLLLNNGMLDEGTILFIDEPEANLNPKLMGFMVELLLELSRHGVQIFVASHSFVMFKSLEQRRLESDRLRFHSLYRDNEQDGKICCESHDNPLDLVHDPILEAYNELYDRDIAEISKRIRQGS
jgi:predicted ATPase